MINYTEEALYPRENVLIENRYSNNHKGMKKAVKLAQKIMSKEENQSITVSQLSGRVNSQMGNSPISRTTVHRIMRNTLHLRFRKPKRVHFNSSNDLKKLMRKLYIK